MRIVGDTTQKSPIDTNAFRHKILSDRNCEYMGSRWDDKVLNDTGLTVLELRWRVSTAKVDDGWTYSKIRETFHVSDGFISKWSGIYRAHKETVETTGHYATNIRTKMKSISNRPHSAACPVRDAIRKEVVERRTKFGFEGSDRIKAALKLDVSPTTINKILREEGLLDKPKKRHRDLTYGRYERAFPNDLWHTDFKSWICNGVTYHSIWIEDDRSRFIPGFHIDYCSSADIVIDMISKAVSTFGKPRQILTDHGTEFYSVLGGKGRSKLDKWCKENGIEHIFSRVRHPQTNGKMERTHRSAKEEIPYFGGLSTLEETRKTFGKWVDYHNNDCPHQALDYDCPINVYLCGCFIYEEMVKC